MCRLGRPGLREPGRPLIVRYTARRPLNRKRYGTFGSTPSPGTKHFEGD